MIYTHNAHITERYSRTYIIMSISRALQTKFLHSPYNHVARRPHPCLSTNCRPHRSSITYTLSSTSLIALSDPCISRYSSSTRAFWVGRQTVNLPLNVRERASSSLQKRGGSDLPVKTGAVMTKLDNDVRRYSLWHRDTPVVRQLALPNARDWDD